MPLLLGTKKLSANTTLGMPVAVFWHQVLPEETSHPDFNEAALPQNPLAQPLKCGRRHASQFEHEALLPARGGIG